MTNNKTYSAGGVVVNSNGHILLVQEYGFYWGLPRGHIEAGETQLTAAIREITEETGLDNIRYVKALGSYERYRFNKEGHEDQSELKHITFFLFTTGQSMLQPRDKAITATEWVPPSEVAARFIHPKDSSFYESCLTDIKRVQPS